jgi:hypothetical protein
VVLQKRVKRRTLKNFTLRDQYGSAILPSEELKSGDPRGMVCIKYIARKTSNEGFNFELKYIRLLRDNPTPTDDIRVYEVSENNGPTFA